MVDGCRRHTHALQSVLNDGAAVALVVMTALSGMIRSCALARVGFARDAHFVPTARSGLTGSCAKAAEGAHGNVSAARSRIFLNIECAPKVNPSHRLTMSLNIR